MRCVYVLMYKKNGPMDVSVDRPYAVFEDSITAEKMKRDGDEIVKVPFFRMDQLVITDNDTDLEKIQPLNNTPWKITYQPIPCKDSTMAPPDYNAFPKVTCSNKTVDEHTWRDRSD